MERVAVLKCGVCFESFSGSASTRGDFSHHTVASGCGHVYHHGCLQSWLTLNRDQRPCPSCRTKICRTDVIRIFPQFATDDGELEKMKREMKREQEKKVILYYIIAILFLFCLLLYFDRIG